MSKTYPDGIIYGHVQYPARETQTTAMESTRDEAKNLKTDEEQELDENEILEKEK